MLKLGLIRHGRTRWNLEKRIQGRADTELCPEGMQDVSRWAAVLKPENYDLILSSPMIRARQTSQILSEAIGAQIEFDADLREQDFGEWEGQKLIDIRTQSPGEVEGQESRGWAFCPPGGESRTVVLKRALQAVQRAAVAFDEKQVLVVSHSSVMKTIIYSALGRAFAPDEIPIIKDCHLHEMRWDKKMKIGTLNKIKLL